MKKQNGPLHVSNVVATHKKHHKAPPAQPAKPATPSNPPFGSPAWRAKYNK